MKDAVLFDEKSVSVESPLFYVSTGWFGVLAGFGFSSVEVVVDPDLPAVPQRACVKLVHATYDPEVKLDQPCGVFPTLAVATLAGLLETPAVSGGKIWSLSACDTIALIDVPGIYRLTLNDPAAVGAVTVLLRAMTADSFSRPSALYFGG